MHALLDTHFAEGKDDDPGFDSGDDSLGYQLPPVRTVHRTTMEGWRKARILPRGHGAAFLSCGSLVAHLGHRAPTCWCGRAYLVVWPARDKLAYVSTTRQGPGPETMGQRRRFCAEDFNVTLPNRALQSDGRVGRLGRSEQRCRAVPQARNSATSSRLRWLGMPRRRTRLRHRVSSGSSSEARPSNKGLKPTIAA